MAQPPTSRVLDEHLTLHCMDVHGHLRPLDASFAFDVADPYAVWITFHSPAGDVRWGLSRHLIAEGLTEPTGEGDIQLWPSIDDDGHAIVMVEFCSPDGELVTHVRTAELQRFLNRTLRMVPLGGESEHMDVDRMISGLLLDSDPE
jgi:hypothetical protein